MHECMHVDSQSKFDTHKRGSRTLDKKSIKDLRKLEALAKVRSEWNKVVICVTNTQVPEPPKPAPTSRCLRPRRDEKRQLQ